MKGSSVVYAVRREERGRRLRALGLTWWIGCSVTSCNVDGGLASTSIARSTDVPLAPAAIPMVAASPGAASALARMRALVVRAPASQHEGVGASARPVIPRGVAGRFERVADGVRPTLPRPDANGAVRRVVHPAAVTLPVRADGRVRVVDADSRLGVAFSLVGATEVEVEVADGLAMWVRGGPFGAHVVHRPTIEGTEDRLVFEVRPPREEVRYQIDISEFAGLRLVDGTDTLELLDPTGTPRLRVAPPVVTGADGVDRPATLTLEGCAYDRDAAPPARRPVTAPRATTCEVRVAWARSAVPYPAVLDPTWTSTGSLAVPRCRHTATRMVDGRVLVAGGLVGGGGETSSAEVFDPSTMTWAATGAMSAVRSAHAAAALADGRVFAVGGVDPRGDVYDAAAGLWTATAAGTKHGGRLTATVLDDGTVLAVGGDATWPPVARAETYDTVTDVWTPAADVLLGRYGHVAFRGLRGSVVVAGGGSAAGDQASTEIYDPATRSWTAGPPMGEARTFATATRLGDGRTLVEGGGAGSFEVFDPAAASWGARQPTLSSRLSASAALLPDGRVLLVGGGAASTELCSADAATCESAGDLSAVVTREASVALADGRVISTGGEESFDPFTTRLVATTRLFAFLQMGGACQATLECGPGAWCVDGRCCETACDAPCMACAASKTALADGTCAPVVAHTDPDDDCRDTGGAVCQENGLCDGAGECERYASASACSPSSCTSGAQCASGFCADGVCCASACDGLCEACSLAVKGGGPDGVCEPIGDGLDPQHECPSQGTDAVCVSDGVCNGARLCRASSKGWACGLTSCASSTAQTNAPKCDANGACASEGTTGCGAYACVASACRTSCTSAIDCAPGHLCKNAVCVSLSTAGNGTTCAGGDECQSGHCAQGVCCDGACTDGCVSCLGVENVSGTNGTCSAVKAGTDPKNACAPDSPATCGQDGACDGTGGCELYFRLATKVVCGPAGCDGNKAAQKVCTGAFACSFDTASALDCGAQKCEAGSCAPCVTTSDCAVPASTYCAAGGRCLPKLGQGAVCAADEECDTGHCVDGVCCNTACDGACEWCGVATPAGVCVPVPATEQPKGAGKAACVGAGSTCGGACDGNKRDGCAYPSAGTECAPARCTNASLVAASKCDGAGTCAVGTTQSCGEYACAWAVGDAGSSCKTSCTTGADCRAGAACDTSGAVGVCNASGTTCSGAYAVKSADGTVTWCDGYACTAGACQSTCAAPSDCDQTGGYACTNARCVKAAPDASAEAGADAGTDGATAAPPASADDSGTAGCAVGVRWQQRSSAGEGAVVVAIAALARARRRRRGAGPSDEHWPSAS